MQLLWLIQQITKLTWGNDHGSFWDRSLIVRIASLDRFQDQNLAENICYSQSKPVKKLLNQKTKRLRYPFTWSSGFLAFRVYFRFSLSGLEIFGLTST